MYCLFWVSLVNYISRVKSSPLSLHFIWKWTSTTWLLIRDVLLRMQLMSCQALVLLWRSSPFTSSRPYTHLLNLIPAFPRPHLTLSRIRHPPLYLLHISAHAATSAWKPPLIFHLANSYLSFKVPNNWHLAKLQVKLETLVEASKHIKREYNEETGKHEEVHDDNGRKVYEYHDIDGNFVAGEVFQFFNELVKAFEE